jgi:acetyltransferase-like isoleucine patch superfamily enzyme
MRKIFRKISSFYWKFIATPEEYARHIGVKIGKGNFISTRKFTSEPYLIEIGDNVRIAGGTSFYTHGGIWSLRKLYNDEKLDHFGKIKIGNNSYIGENCMIMPGVTIGERCIIGGGSVVTKSVPDGCMVAGNPAKFIGYTEDFYRKLKKDHDTKTGKLTAIEKKKFLMSMNEDTFEVKPCIKIER